MCAAGHWALISRSGNTYSWALISRCVKHNAEAFLGIGVDHTIFSWDTSRLQWDRLRRWLTPWFPVNYGTIAWCRIVAALGIVLYCYNIVSITICRFDSSLMGDNFFQPSSVQRHHSIESLALRDWFRVLMNKYFIGMRTFKTVFTSIIKP